MKTIQAEQTRRLLDEGTPVLDVLSRKSYDKRHIPGAKNAPEGADDFKERVARLAPDKDAPVVVYCADADCQASPRAAKALERMGYKDVRDFEGGLVAWRRAGYDLTGEPERVQAKT